MADINNIVFKKCIRDGCNTFAKTTAICGVDGYRDGKYQFPECHYHFVELSQDKKNKIKNKWVPIFVCGFDGVK